jgi:hypothetical protein
MAIKLRTLVKHPSRVEGDTGIGVTKENGVVTVALDLGAFAATASVADPQRTTIVLVTPGLTDEDADVVERMAADDFLSLALNFDAELAAIAGLTSAADKLPYFTGAGTAALADLTAYGRALIDDANAGAALTTLGVSAFAQTVLDDTTAGAALSTLGISSFAQSILDDADSTAVRTTLGLVIGTNVQAQDAELSALAGLTSAADKVPYFTGAGTAALADFSNFGRSLVDDPDASAARTTLGLVIGTNVQAQDLELAAIAGLTSAANKLPYFTGSGTAALADLSTFARTLIDDADAAAMRSTLGVGAGTGDMVTTNNLSDLTNIAVALANIDVGRSDFALAGGKIVPSVAGNALTIAVKTNAGNDPSATEPVLVTFRSATLADGGYSIIKLTAANSLVISSGSTIGFGANIPSRLWIVGFNDAGTFRLGASNRFSDSGGIFPLGDNVFQSSVAEGGAGTADSVGVIYTGTVVTSKASRLLAYLDWTSGLATPGTWGANADIWVPFGPGVPKPGEAIHVQMSKDNAVATGTTILPADDTIPQNTEGVLILSRDVIPTAKANLLHIEWKVFLAHSAVGQISTALFQDSAANALCATGAGYRNTDDFAIRDGGHLMRAGTTSVTSFKVRAGNGNAGTLTFNGAAASRQFGGVAGSFLKVVEYMG